MQCFTSRTSSGVRLGCRLQCLRRHGQRRLAVCSWFSSVSFIFPSLNPPATSVGSSDHSICLFLSLTLSLPPSSPRRSYHGYKTMKDFVRRRRWARYYKKQHWHISLCDVCSAGTQWSESRQYTWHLQFLFVCLCVCQWVRAVKWEQKYSCWVISGE